MRNINSRTTCTAVCLLLACAGVVGVPVVKVAGIVNPLGINAEVHITGRGDLAGWEGASIKPGSDGKFEYELPKPGAYTITASARGYASERRYLQYAEATQAELRFDLVRSGGISGRIGNTSPNVMVYAQRKGEDKEFDGVAIPDREGRYRIDGLKPGTYSLIIWTTDYRSVKGVSPSVRSVDAATRAAVTGIIAQSAKLESSGRYADAIPLYSKRYSCGTQTYSAIVSTLREEDEDVRKRAQAEGGADRSKVVDPIRFQPLLICEVDGNVEAICFTLLGDSLGRTSWGNYRYNLFRLARENGRWLITADCDFSPAPVIEAMPVIDSRLAGIVVESGKTSAGHDYTLAIEEPKLPPKPIRLPAE